MSEIYGSSRDLGDTTSGGVGPERSSDTRGQADRDPHYYDGDLQEALARDTTLTRQQAWRDAVGDTYAPDGQDDGDDDPWGEDPDTENYKILDQNNGRFPTWAEMADEHPVQAGDDTHMSRDDPWDTYPDAEAGIAEMDRLPSPAEPYAATWGDHHIYCDETDLLGEEADAIKPVLDQAPTLTPEASQGTADAAVQDEQQHSDSRELDKDTGAHATDRNAGDREVLQQRVTELEARNAELGETVKDLKARLQRVEQNDLDRTREEISGRRVPDADRELEQQEKEERRVGPSDEALVFGAAAVGGVLTTVADFVAVLPTTYAGIGASVLAAGAAGVAWIHKRREARHADRSQG